MEKVHPWCGRPSDRGRLKNRTEHRLVFECHSLFLQLVIRLFWSARVFFSVLLFTLVAFSESVMHPCFCLSVCLSVCQVVWLVGYILQVTHKGQHWRGQRTYRRSCSSVVINNLYHPESVCEITTQWKWKTIRKSHVAYRNAPFPTTWSNLQSHSSTVSLSKWDFSYNCTATVHRCCTQW